jgi:hypothetical protein
MTYIPQYYKWKYINMPGHKEKTNKNLKSWIPKRVPTDEIWQTVCRNNSVLEKIKKNKCSLFGIGLESSAFRYVDIEKTVQISQLLEELGTL